MTGHTSRNTSGYTAGPSHSTSVTGLVVGPITHGPPSSVNSSVMSHSISSILPVNSGATHNTPNTSYADTSNARSVKESEQYLDIPDVSRRSALSLKEQTSSMLSGYSHSLTLSPPAASSDTGSTVTSLIFDEKSGDATNAPSHALSHASTTTTTTDQSQATTAPSVSMTWDSLSLGTTTGGATGLGAPNNMSGNSETSSGVSQKTATEGATASSSDPSSGGERPPPSRTGAFEWDTYPFDDPGGRQTPGEGHAGYRKLTPIDPGNTGPPPPRPLEARPPYPLLAATQYWV